ncbi:RagB/SusD family nutrient uptake outer membrane protein [Carboxylicivirga sp. A043]|uniref:RagB/SusD family nutrient uptake outer membrane protein n=1 Tax=Carboxylicivirga litoralis TaxID=2816963 RepID=UPI0021CAFDBD|nr:RagB/SusD family nutrient uptake outer membrane protein [Carboxylicivirga sp. A043]MCU4156729.1 RagB/SusD family nutrient uptake outer membrane protein [Carboxylicivirga sp. A043]
MKRIFNYIFISLLGFAMVACDLWSDVDEAKPYYVQTEDASYATLKGINANVNGMYSLMRGFQMTEPAKNAGQLAGIYNDPWQQETDYMRVMVTVDDNYTNQYYLNWYQLIASANYLVKNLKDLAEGQVEGLSLARRDEIIGEAKIARAIGHFELLKLFGYYYDLNSEYGIPVVTSVLSEAPLRSSVQQVYDAIMKDLDEGITYAPEGINRQLFTVLTAKAIKAKVALYMRDYSTAAILANDVIENGGFSLETNYTDIFLEGFASEEVIFSPNAINYDEYIGPSNEYTNSPSDMLKALADEQVEGVGNEATGEGYDARYAYTHAWDLLPLWAYNGKYPPKWDFNQPGNSYNYLRLAELYFIQAEAEARLASDDINDSRFVSALSRVNQLRDRVSMAHAMPAGKAELLQTIRIDKMMELLLEWGEPWSDMVRYHFLGDINISAIRGFEIQDWQLTYPFNLRTLNANTRLVQNPGYIGVGESN